jgi:hypothetical protein
MYLSNGIGQLPPYNHIQFLARLGQAQQPPYARPIQPRGAPPKKQSLRVGRGNAIIEDDDDDEADIGDGMEENHYANVLTEELQALGLYKHPSPVSEAASLGSVRLPDVDYALKLPGHVISSKHAS